ncbi:MAG: mechanosensitive ion channel domain-containing protein [Anaerolineae bacterium]|jgi:small-conductance mechanosensitive channel
MRRKLALIPILIVVALFVPLSALHVVAWQTPPESTAGAMASAPPAQAGSAEATTPEPLSSPGAQNATGEAADGDSPADESPTPEPTDLLEGVILTRTPEPTATPGRVEQQVEDLVEAVGLAETAILGISVVTWINLAISLLYVLAGYLIGTWLIRRVFARLVKRTGTEFDDQLLEAVGGDVRWLVVLLTLSVATVRLTFLRAGLKVVLSDVYFVIALGLSVRIIFRVIALADTWARQRVVKAGREGEVEHVIVLLTRVGRVLTAVLAAIILLSRFGVDVTALGAALGLGGLAFTLAAQDTIADAIAGVIILVDRPFRIGDRIEIQGAGTWGDVVNIGLRTTRIRTRDNRVIILPNSTIGSNQVMNYSYPDLSYRSETQLSVGYDTDLEVARRLIVDTVRGVDGVLADKPVDALYIEMGDSGIVFRVRWWIGTYALLRRNLDQVHTALQAAFDQAGIPFASTTQTIKLQADSETVRRVASSLRSGDGKRHEGAPHA